MAASNIKVMIPCDIQKVWETILAVEHYPTWRSGVSKTEIDFTTSVTAKKLSVRPVGKSVFEQTYLKKEQTEFVTDLKKALG